MLVEAKCVIKSWDSSHAFMYEPGMGPLPGGLYKIDRDGPMASQKLGSTYCFDFDRAAPNGAVGNGVPSDYTCKKCGKKFKTLPSLGTHNHSAHNDGEGIEGTPEDEEPMDLSDRTCFICEPPKVLKSKHGLRLHNEKSHPFQSQPKIEAETAVPA